MAVVAPKTIKVQNAVNSPSFKKNDKDSQPGLKTNAPNTRHNFSFARLNLIKEKNSSKTKDDKAELRVNEPNDSFEKEAEEMEKVIVSPLSGISEKSSNSEEPGNDRLKHISNHYPRIIQAKFNQHSGCITPPVQQKAQILQTDGKELDRPTSEYMERRFGYSFKNVRIHDDRNAHHASYNLGARAFTLGNHIAFAEGQYVPGSIGGNKLIAHELTHVLQQRNFIQRKVAESAPRTENMIEEESQPASELDSDDESIVEQFTIHNKGLRKASLKKWIIESLEKGWVPGMPVPDYKIPDISFNEKDEPVIESVDFRGSAGAFSIAAKLLPKDVGARFWWKQRFTEKIGVFTLDYASDKAYRNLLLHEKEKDVNLEAIQKVAKDDEDYEALKAMKSYTSQLLSEAFLRFIAKAQSNLYSHDLARQTGVLDSITMKDIDAKIASDKSEAEKKAIELAAKKAEKTEEGVDQPVVQNGPIHDVIKEKIAGLQRDLSASIPIYIQVADNIAGSVPLPIPTIPTGLLYRVSQHFMIGFLKYLDTLPEEEIRKKFMHLLTVQFTPGYLWGQVKGVPQGIWNWIKDMAELIWDLVKLPYTITKFMVVTLPDAVKSLYDNAKVAMEWFESNTDVVFKFAKDLLSGSGDEFSKMEDVVKGQIYGMAENLGSSAAGKISDLAGKSNEEIGVAIGKIEGYLLPDIILAVFSEGIGNALKEGLQFVKVFIETGRAGAMSLKALEAGKAGIAAIERFLESAKIFAKEGYAKIKTMFKDILEYFKKILGIEEKGLAEAKTAGRLVDEGKAISRLESEAGESAKSDAKKYAEKTVEDGADKKSKTSILWKAIVIAEVADLKNLPVKAAIAELDLLKVLNQNVSFYSEGTDPYEIWMKGSRYSVDPYYTAGGSGIKRTRTSPSKHPNDMATAQGKSDLEKGGRADISPENRRALENERPVADALAKAGYEVEFTEGKISAAERKAEGLRATAEPDLRIEGKLMDIYSPSRHSNPVSAVENMFSKVRDPAGAQTRRVVVALDDSSISRTQFQTALKKSLREFGDFGMQEIFVVQKGVVFKLYP